MTDDFINHFFKLAAAAMKPVLNSWDAGDLAENYTLEPASQRGHGDLATGIALVAASRLKRPPRELAAKLISVMRASSELNNLARCEVAGPGFINFFFNDGALMEAVQDSLALGAGFGSVKPAARSRKILLEFVSANPTGQLHVGHARYAAYGDSLKRIIEFAGYRFSREGPLEAADVTAEFYVNDYGSQMDIFGRTLAARYAEALCMPAEFPEDGYRGDYPRRLATLIKEEIGGELASQVSPSASPSAVAFFKQRGCEIVLSEMRNLLQQFRVRFDSWFSEAGLYESGQAAAVIDELRTRKQTFDKDGALWLKTAARGDDKDRVLIRSGGEPTYFASDIAYHSQKLARGYDRLINIWGADHHGYVRRMQAAFAALSHDPDKLEIIIGQLVNVIEQGERKQMSKRAGTMVTLEELLGSIGIDAARFFLVDRSHDSTLDLDLEKAKQKTEENPVYYVQYAHARISSILRKAAAENIPASEPHGGSLERQERELILHILWFPATAAAASTTHSPQRLTAYARELAAAFHVFYHNCPVLKAEPAQAAFRLELCRLTRNVIARSLDLVGVSAPEQM